MTTQVGDTSWRYKFKIQVRETSCRFKLEILVWDTSWRLKFKIQVGDTRWLKIQVIDKSWRYIFKIQVQNTSGGYKFKIKVKDTSWRSIEVKLKVENWRWKLSTQLPKTKLTPKLLFIFSILKSTKANLNHTKPCFAMLDYACPYYDWAEYFPFIIV